MGMVGGGGERSEKMKSFLSAIVFQSHIARGENMSPQKLLKHDVCMLLCECVVQQSLSI